MTPCVASVEKGLDIVSSPLFYSHKVAEEKAPSMRWKGL